MSIAELLGKVKMSKSIRSKILEDPASTEILQYLSRRGSKGLTYVELCDAVKLERKVVFERLTYLEDLGAIGSRMDRGIYVAEPGENPNGRTWYKVYLFPPELAKHPKKET